MKRPTSLKSPEPTSAASGSPFDWARESGLSGEIAAQARAQAQARARRRVRRQRALAAVASLALLAAVGAIAYRPAQPVSPPALARGETKIIAPERRVLPDGSIVDLRGGAEITTAFSATVRRIALVRGEAHFEVVKDRARPFIVSTLDVEVRAVGTAFVVERGAKSVEVMVTEGQVAVGRPGALPPPAATGPVRESITRADAALVAAGQRTSVALSASAASATTVSEISPEDISRRLAWRVPRLEFESAPLAEVIRLFADHGGARFVLADPALGDVRVSGFLRADRAEALLQLLASDHGIKSEFRGDEIVLRQRR